MSDEWLIVKRGLYYRPAGQGYTGIRDYAGRYSHEEAKRHESPHDEPVTIIPLAGAPEYSKACFPDLALKHACEKIASLRARIAELESALKPFAKVAEVVSSVPDAYDMVRNAHMFDVHVPMSDFRRARALLPHLGARGEEDARASDDEPPHDQRQPDTNLPKDKPHG